MHSKFVTNYILTLLKHLYLEWNASSFFRSPLNVIFLRSGDRHCGDRKKNQGRSIQGINALGPQHIDGAFHHIQIPRGSVVGLIHLPNQMMFPAHQLPSPVRSKLHVNYYNHHQVQRIICTIIHITYDHHERALFQIWQH